VRYEFDEEGDEDIEDILIPVKSETISAVVFPHTLHAWWLNCKSCHPRRFTRTAGETRMTMKEMAKGTGRRMEMKQQLLIACALFLLLFADGRSLTAAEAGSGGVPPDMTPEKLEKEVQRRFKYIEQRLLSGRSARTIEESGNARAMEILRRSKERMGTISQWISEGRLEDAYLALRELGRSMRQRGILRS